MTERSNDAPEDDLEPKAVDDSPTEAAPIAEPPAEEPPVADALPVGDEIAEEARDLSDADLEVAAAEAVSQVEAEDAGVVLEQPDVEDELEADAEADADAEVEADAGEQLEDELEAEADEELEAETEPEEALPRGARARAEALRARERQAREEREARLAQRDRRDRLGRRRATEPEPVRGSAKTPFPIDPALRIKDPISTAFVAASILVFVGIFLYAMAFGKKGAFTPERTPRPTPSLVAPSGSPGASGSPGPSVSPAPSGAAPSGSPAASVAPSPAASIAPSPSGPPVQ